MMLTLDIEGKRKMTLAVDFDGTLVPDNTHVLTECDEEFVEAVKRAQKRGHQIVLHTCRHEDRLYEALRFMMTKGLIFNRVSSRKTDADFYYDNKTFNWNRDLAIAHINSLP